MRNGTTIYGGINSGIKWKRLAIGGGGFTMRPKVSSDGSMTISTDTVCGLYRGPSATEWVPMITTATPGASPYTATSLATLDTAIHPTNSSYMAVWTMDVLWLSTNGGASFAAANLAANTTLSPYGAKRVSGGWRLEYDSSTSILAFADATVGLRYTTDGGANWTTVASITAPTVTTDGGNAFVAFDRSSTVTGGKFQTVFAYSYGRGVYRSTTGINGTFSLLNSAGMPTDLSDMKVGPTGILHVVDGAGVPHRYTGGAWSTVTVSDAAVAVCPHATDATKVYWFNGGGSLWGSSDSGATSDRNDWNVGTRTRIATDIPWLAWTKEDFMGNGGGFHDGTSLWIGEGIGCWKITNPLPNAGTQTAATVTSVTKGIEQLNSMEFTWTPNNRLIGSFLDRAALAWDTAYLDRYPTRIAPDALTQLSHGSSNDYAPDNPDVIVATGSYIGKQLVKSTNGGLDWSVLASIPDSNNTYSGNIAVASTTNFVWVPSGNLPPYYTTDGGASWTLCTFPVSMTGMKFHSFGTGAGIHRKMLAVDKATGYFYMFIVASDATLGTATDLAAKGIWRSIDGGANWVRRFADYFVTQPVDSYHCRLKTVYGQAGDLFYCPGDIGGGVGSAGLFFSHDSMGTVTQLTGFKETYDVTTGKAFPGRSYPAVYAYGYNASDVLALRRCIDFNPASPNSATWTVIGVTYPLNWCDTLPMLSADMNSYKIAFCWGGSGAAIGDLDDTAHGT